LKTLQQRHPGLDWTAIDEVIYGCANQAGEEEYPNVARMSALLAGLQTEVPRGVGYTSIRPDDAACPGAMKTVATDRRRFGYRPFRIV
jgi:hypothetical protein